MMMLKWLLQHVGILLSLAMLSTPFLCQAQSIAIKNDALYDALLIPNLGMETKIGERTTLDIEGTYDPITFPGRRKWKNWLVQPELRHWGCVPFFGMFVGINGMAGGFNVARVPVFNFDEKRIQGTFYGGGLTLGNHHIISPHWGLETKVNLDFVHISYSRYRCSKCGYKEENVTTNYIGPTRVSVSLVYIIR
jgi:hypothetical protein